jgi:hypothetical protein
LWQLAWRAPETHGGRFAQPVALASSSGGGGGSVQEDVQLTVKYLASRKLIRLQLQDAALRRHFLLQALIFLHACQNPVVKKDQQRRDALRSKQVRRCYGMTQMHASCVKILVVLLHIYRRALGGRKPCVDRSTGSHDALALLDMIKGEFCTASL